MKTHKEHFLKTQQLHENTFHRILWDDKSRVIGIDWLEGTSSMTDEDFKKELTLFADQVEAKKAVGILVNVAQFRHKPGPDMTEWRVKNISGRYLPAVTAGCVRYSLWRLKPMMNSASKIHRFPNGIAYHPTTWTEAKPASGNSASSREQFEAIMLAHFDAAYAHARCLTGNGHDASDVVQESYLRALRFFSSFQGGNSKAWLLTIVRNTHRSWLRREQAARRVAAAFDQETRFEHAEKRDAEEQLVEEASARILRDCLEALAPEYREILVMREFEDMSYRQIACVAGLPVGTVMSRLSRARQQLKQLFLSACNDAVSAAA